MAKKKSSRTPKGGRSNKSSSRTRKPGKGKTKSPKSSMAAGPMRRKARSPNVRRSPEDGERLQRVLASAGLGSRRECETLIEEGRVEVDGNVVTQLGTRVQRSKQKIKVDGVPVKFQRLEYFAVNKPPGVVSTSRDPSGRPRVIDLIKTQMRVYNVGRLDKSSEGLILVTNDGDLAHRLTHPSYSVQKIYLVQVVGRPEVSELRKLERGVYLAEGFAQVVGAKIKKRTKESTWLEITLDEGRNREIRRLLARIGHKVLKLRRIAIGLLRLGELPLGAHRRLDRSEVDALKRAGDRSSAGRHKKKSRRKKDSASKRGASPSSQSSAKKKTTFKKRGTKVSTPTERGITKRKKKNKKAPNKKAPSSHRKQGNSKNSGASRNKKRRS